MRRLMVMVVWEVRGGGRRGEKGDLVSEEGGEERVCCKQEGGECCIEHEWWDEREDQGPGLEARQKGKVGGDDAS